MVTFSQSNAYPCLLDAHVHLTHNLEHPYPSEFYYFTNSATPDEWSFITDIASEHVFPFLGIHPECGPGPMDDIGWEHNLDILKTITDSSSIGIGECGIDSRYYPMFSKQEQISLLEAQIAIAVSTESPMSIHQVHATESLLSIIKEQAGDIPWIMHGFFGSRQTAKRILDMGGYISLSPNLLRSKNKLKDLLSYLPDEYLLLETDFPYTYIPAIWKDLPYGELLHTWYRVVATERVIDIDRLIDIVLNNGSVFTNKSPDWRKTAEKTV